MSIPLTLTIVALILAVVDGFVPNRWLLNVAIVCLALALLV